MIKKLTSFLFKEEEIIIEEAEHEVEPVSIKPLEPLVEKPLRKRAASILEEDKSLPNPVTIEPKPVEEEKLVKKSVMIDLEEKPNPTKREPVQEVQASLSEYRRRNVISPIHGGPEKEAVVDHGNAYALPKTKQKMHVLSPMYGSVKQEGEEDGYVDLNLDLKDMLSSEPVQEEVQASLFDFMTESDDDA